MIKFGLTKAPEINFDFNNKLRSVTNKKFSLKNLALILTGAFLLISFEDYMHKEKYEQFSINYTMQKKYNREQITKVHVIQMLKAIEQKNYQNALNDLRKENYLNENAFANFIMSNKETLVLRAQSDIKFDFKDIGSVYTTTVGTNYELNNQPYSIIEIPFRETWVNNDQKNTIEKIASVTVQNEIIIDFKINKINIEEKIAE